MLPKLYMYLNYDFQAYGESGYYGCITASYDEPVVKNPFHMYKLPQKIWKYILLKSLKIEIEIEDKTIRLYSSSLHIDNKIKLYTPYTIFLIILMTIILGMEIYP